MVEIRRLRKEELDEADLIWLQAFERGSRSVLENVREFQELFSDRVARFGLWDSAGMQATFQMFGTFMKFGPDVILPAAYISSIACKPAARGRGYGGDGLVHLLGHMRDSGQVVTTLCPSTFGYYRQFGWEWINVERSYRIPARVLKVDPETEYVRTATAEDRAGIKGVYQQICERYRGMGMRDDREWDCLFDGSKTHLSYCYVYERDGRVEGYIVYSGGNHIETHLMEFLTFTPRSLRALLGLLSRLKVQTQMITWDAPEDDGLWTQCLHLDIKTELRPSRQGRIVDVSVALASLKPDSELRGSVTLDVHDANAAWNNGVWKVTIESGSVSAELTSETPHLSLDIQALTQSFFGVQSVQTLRRQDRLVVHDEWGFNLFAKLLTGPPMWITGLF